MQSRIFDRFIGVDLGGGKGKTTAVAILRPTDGRVAVEMLAPRLGEAPLYDDALIDLLERKGTRAVVAIDAPLTLPPCLRCQVPVCPGQSACVDPAVMAMRGLADDGSSHRDLRRGKPPVTPYTQRVTEVYLHRRRQVLPRETLGQGMGPLTARAAHLVRALAGRFRLDENLLEVYPKATLRLMGIDKPYKKSAHEREARAEILDQLNGDLAFAPGVWREDCVQSDHVFDAVICAYTAYLWHRDGWQRPSDVFAPPEDGWIWVQPEESDSETEPAESAGVG